MTAARTAPLVFVLLSLGFQVLASALAKEASLGLASFTLAGILGNKAYLLSLACLVLQSLCWPFALRGMPLFQAHLYMSGIYLALPALGRFVFHESLSPQNLAGTVLIAGGILLVFKGRREGSHG